jgi:hypothetical protein
MIHGAFCERGGNGSPVFFKNMLFERAAVDTDSNRNSISLTFIGNCFDFFIRTDVESWSKKIEKDTAKQAKREAKGKKNKVWKN